MFPIVDTRRMRQLFTLAIEISTIKVGEARRILLTVEQCLRRRFERSQPPEMNKGPELEFDQASRKNSDAARRFLGKYIIFL